VLDELKVKVYVHMVVSVSTRSRPLIVHENTAELITVYHVTR